MVVGAVLIKDIKNSRFRHLMPFFLIFTASDVIKVVFLIAK